MEIKKSAIELTKKDMAKLIGATKAYKDVVDQPLKVVNAIIYEDADRSTGEIREYSALYTDKGVVAGNSSVMTGEISSIIDLGLITAKEPLACHVIMEKSKSGKDFCDLFIE